MPTYNVWDYTPIKHDFKHIANVPWPGKTGEQLDWIIGVHSVEEWLKANVGSKYDTWAWNMGIECYTVSVAFKLAKHKTFFLLTWV